MLATNKKKKVLVAVSGGVDSALAAFLLRQSAAYQVSGIFLNFWRETIGDFADNKCCSFSAQMDAKQVCLNLDLPFYTHNFSAAFKREVVDNFINEYQNGRTPNPCVICNKKIKLGGLINYARSLGFDYVASGHYARIEKSPGQPERYRMFRASDRNKDQSYFLYALSQKQLAHLLLPLSGLKKTQVRRLAKKAGLAVAEKKDSQEICFIPEKHHNHFLSRHLKLKAGRICLWPEKKTIGQHQGLPLYTIGQRRGINIGGTGPYYAAKFDFKNNVLYVVKNFADPILYRRELEVKKINWIDVSRLKFPLKSKVVLRYRHRAVSCLIDYDYKKNTAQVKLARPQRAITPGQSAVFYQQDEVLGGGIIS